MLVNSQMNTQSFWENNVIEKRLFRVKCVIDYDLRALGLGFYALKQQQTRCCCAYFSSSAVVIIEAEQKAPSGLPGWRRDKQDRMMGQGLWGGSWANGNVCVLDRRQTKVRTWWWLGRVTECVIGLFLKGKKALLFKNGEQNPLNLCVQPDLAQKADSQGNLHIFCPVCHCGISFLTSYPLLGQPTSVFFTEYCAVIERKLLIIALFWLGLYVIIGRFSMALSPLTCSLGTSV